MVLIEKKASSNAKLKIRAQFSVITHMALTMLSSFRMLALSATFIGLPAAMSMHG
jgi:hypothetical protein